MRLLQFLESHFNAGRLGNPHAEKCFLRLLNVTLDGLKHSTGHPLSREIRLHIILFGLKVMRHVTSLDFHSRSLLKDKILSAALSWFSFAPRWSFGGNRVQVKAEIRLLGDVSLALKNVQMVGNAQTSLLKSISNKENLLSALMESELVRLNVWLHPMGDATGVPSKGPAEVSETSLTFKSTDTCRLPLWV
jgi:phosphatidylinositol 4-kinase